MDTSNTSTRGRRTTRLVMSIKNKFISFSEWLNLREVGTSTASVATYAMPLFGGPFARQFPQMIGGREVKKKKKKHRD